MAKSSRSSTKKENNRRKAASVFGPAESARAERLSAKLLELVRESKPDTSDAKMEDKEEPARPSLSTSTMVIDEARPAQRKIATKRVDKRKTKKASIVFPKYSDRLKAKNKKKRAT